jgi:hypothetical protein
MTLLTAKGASGAEYQLGANPLGTKLTNDPGVYIFCHQDRNGDWIAHYVGQANGALGLDNRVGSCVRSHEKYDDAVGLGATHIAAGAVSDGDDAICRIENDLIQGLNPPLNQNAPPGFGLLSGLR